MCGVILVTTSAFPDSIVSPLKMFALRLPKTCHGAKQQQLAELYAAKVGIFKSAQFSPPGRRLALISDSTSSILTLLKFSTKARHFCRGRILRQIARKTVACSMSFSLGFVRSKVMPADIPSRFSDPVVGGVPDDLLLQCSESLSGVIWSREELVRMSSK